MKRPRTTYRDDEPGHHIAVYNGREVVGYLIERNCEVHAYCAGGQLVGSFLNRDEARRGLLNAVRK